MATINPLETAEEIRDTYALYLQSLLKTSDVNISKALKQAISDSVNSEGGIVKGPFLEATPPYTAGKSIRELVSEGILSPEFLKLDSSSLPLDRPLYSHQEASIRKLAAGRNVIVATGTGSGKTESFLFPILNELMKEKERGELGSGVKALLLYPMNALANDQVKRIREYLTGYPEITFGRYTGETRQTEKEAIKEYFLAEGRNPLPNEIISRDAMQETPPNILLTNYAMLEYLLLRPADNSLFDGPSKDTWKFIVADEAHTYDGAHGIEVATLLRKLRERVDIDHKIQTIGTTATIGGTDLEVQTFAENLFDNKFEIDGQTPETSDLVRPSRKPIAEGTWGPLDSLAWSQISNEDELKAVAAPSTLPLWEAFQTESSVSKLRKALFEGPADLAAAAQLTFGADSEEAKQAVTNIVELGAKIKDGSGNPAFSARFHLFARATEGIFGCLSEEPHFYLNRHTSCPDCSNIALELAGCKKCGASYYIGFDSVENGIRAIRPEAQGKDPVYILSNNFTLAEDNEDDDQVDEVDPHDQDLKSGTGFMCTSCGTLAASTAGACISCGGNRIHEVTFQASRNKCGKCGSVSKPVLRKLESGNDAAGSVLATELYQHMPPSDDEDEANLPGAGRKLMVFSDSRQQAAFFAPYIEDAYARILWRKVVFQGLIRTMASNPTEESFVLSDLEPAITTLADEARLFAPDATHLEKKKVVRERLHFEAVSTDTQINLEGTGLVNYLLEFSEDDSAFEAFTTLGFTHKQGRDLVQVLLGTLRLGGILSAEDGVEVGSDLFAPRTGPLFIREAEPNKKIKTYAWSPKTRSNTRLDYLSRVLTAMGSTAEPKEILSKIWKLIFNPGSQLNSVFISKVVGNNGTLSQLNHKKLHMKRARQDDAIFECDRCGRVSSISVANVCPRYRCKGSLAEVDRSVFTGGIFYSRQYEDGKLIALRAEEHTAQLTNDEARSVQNDFIKGKVNVLSSSTTFELGVDVGELQSVFLRNVPPSVANYLQRAGRAGRRADSAALILTYAQRRPHDLSKYADPVSMVAGKMRAPYIELGNQRILQRHVYSIFFARFLREKGIKTAIKAQDFFIEGNPTWAETMPDWLTDNAASLKASFLNVVPKELSDKANEIWTKTMSDFVELLSQVSKKFKDEVAEYTALIAAAYENQRGFEGDRLKGALKTILEKDIISFLSKENLIPKYGFPVDTVALVPPRLGNNSNKVELDRDLSVAIFEYAPGSSVIAAGYTWESVGIGYVQSKEFKRMQYAHCPNCDEYTERISSDVDRLTNCASCQALLPKVHKYIIPEWGFIAQGGAKRPSDVIKKTYWNRELYLSSRGNAILVNGQKTPGKRVTAELRTIAELVVVNSGPNYTGYQMCPSCKAAFPGTMQNIGDHPKPYNPDKICKTFALERIHLGHKYQSDIVQVKIDLKGSGLDAKSLARSTAYSLLEGASNGLQIAHDDIDVIPLPSDDTTINLALVDAVPAGAGFAKLIAENVKLVFESAYERVAGCECGEETSCYECLRTYRNQREHDSLVRGDALTVLKVVLNK